jgi:hypothetical protein
MHYDFIDITDAEIPRAAEQVFQHLLTTYASEANKTASVWRAVPDDQSFTTESTENDHRLRSFPS